MGFLTGWISNIVLIILFAVIVDLLIPNNSFQKYIKMVIGLLLILAILNPLLKMAGSNVDKVFDAIGVNPKVNENDIKNSIDTKKRELQDSQAAYTLEQTHVRMKKQVKEELMANYGVAILELKFIPKSSSAKTELTPEDISAVNVVLGKDGSAKEISIPAVQKVEIDASEPMQDQQGIKVDAKPIQNFLAKKWQMKAKNIHIYTEGGEGIDAEKR